MIRAENSIQIARPAAVIFGFIDDFSKAPWWPQSCVELTLRGAEAKKVGAGLHHVYLQVGRRGEREGIVSAYDQDRRLELQLVDSMFEVTMATSLVEENGGTTVTHAATTAPRTFVETLRSPLIGLGNRRQVASNLARLKQQREAKT